MFTVGEFARLAQVSKRLLRYYDEIDLFKPSKVDTTRGFRLYSAEQLSQLNRILALKDLGLSLDQIRRALTSNVSTEEIQGMLLMKKSEIEQQLQEELQRIRKIESRLQLIRDDEMGKPLNVIVKSLPALPVLSIRRTFDTFDDSLEMYRQIDYQLGASSKYGLGFCICYSDVDTDQNLDIEFGRLLENKTQKSITLHNGLELQYRQLPAIEAMATIVVTGALETLHQGYVNIARWSEANNYRPAGIARELTLLSPQKTDGSDMITEIQMPVEPIQTI